MKLVFDSTLTSA